MITLAQRIPRPIPAYLAATAAWVLAMIALPIGRWIAGDAIIPAAATLTTLFQLMAVALITWESWGARRTLTALAVVSVVTWGMEFLGSRTGFPFGSYHYTPVLQPQILGVPLLIPAAWFMMLVPSWAVADAIVGHRTALRQQITFLIASALAMTAWDLYLDPQMTGWGFWVWDEPSGYFGIPWTNYAGWLLTAGLATAAVRPARLTHPAFLMIYGIVWILQAIGMAVFWGQTGPALVGFAGMGVMLGLAVFRKRQG